MWISFLWCFLYYVYSGHIMSYFSSFLNCCSSEIETLIRCLSFSLALCLSVYQSLFLCSSPFFCLSPSDVEHNSRSKNEMIYSMWCLWDSGKHAIMAEMKYCNFAADPRLHQHEGMDTSVVYCLCAHIIFWCTLCTCMDGIHWELFLNSLFYFKTPRV